VLIGSLFVIRFWCRYFCPLAVIVGLIGKLAIFKVERHTGKCVSPKKPLCDRLCPMGIKISQMERIDTVECNSCLDCLEVAHVANALSLQPPKSNKKLKPLFYPIILLVIFFGVIYTSKLFGIWIPGWGPGGGGRGPGFRSSQVFQETITDSTSDTLQHKTGDSEVRSGSRKSAEEETAKGEERIIKIGDNEVVIMGNMSFAQIEELTGVPSSYIISKLNLPPNVSPNANLGNLRKQYGFLMQDVRKYIREYLEKNKK